MQNLCFSQTKTIGEDERLFDKGCYIQTLLDDDFYRTIKRKKLDTTIQSKEIISLIEKSILNQAEDNYQKIIDDYKDSKFYFRALNNLGYIYLKLKNISKAREIFLKILSSNANDKEKGGAGSGIMAEPYANYKNRATISLAKIALEDSNYLETINFLDSTKKYPYRHFCGNEFESNKIYIATQYIRAYIGLKDFKKAYETGLPLIIESGLASNEQIVDLTYSALLKLYPKEKLKNDFEQSVKNIYVEHKITKKGYQIDSEYITFLQTNIYIPKMISYRRINNEENVQKKCLESKFYKLISQ